MIIKSVAIFLNSSKGQSLKAYRRVARVLKDKNISYYNVDSAHAEDIKPDTDLLISLGGDGTLLKAARAAAGLGIKIVGVNGGTLGFLSAVEAHEEGFAAFFEDILTDNYTAQERGMLEVRILRGGQEVFKENALNECVLKTKEARAVSVNVFYNNDELKEYFGDGIIIATPTGSTAYNLAAGGPIIYPGTGMFVLTPICPHTLTQRPLVLPSNNSIKLQLSARKRGLHVSLNLDGQINRDFAYEEEVYITKSPRAVSIIYPKDYNFFNVLTSKLKWGR
jgi:NAD+ kinase